LGLGKKLREGHRMGVSASVSPAVRKALVRTRCEVGGMMVHGRRRRPRGGGQSPSPLCMLRRRSSRNWMRRASGRVRAWESSV